MHSAVDSNSEHSAVNVLHYITVNLIKHYQNIKNERRNRKKIIRLQGKSQDEELVL